MIDYNAITASAALVAALTAIIAVWLEGRRGRFLQGLDLLLRLGGRFESGDLLEARRALATLLLKDELSLEKSLSQPKDALISQILNHYQLVGMLLQKGALDKELVYSEYFNKLNHYFTFLRPYMASYRKEHDDPTIWEDVDWLYTKLSAIERKYLPRGADILPSRESIVEFFHEEKNLERAR